MYTHEGGKKGRRGRGRKRAKEGERGKRCTCTYHWWQVYIARTAMRNREISSRFITTAAEPFTGLNRYNLHNRGASTTAAGSRGRHYSILRRLSFRTQRKSNLITHHRVVHLLGQMGKQESPLINLFMTLACGANMKNFRCSLDILSATRGKIIGSVPSCTCYFLSKLNKIGLPFAR